MLCLRFFVVGLYSNIIINPSIYTYVYTIKHIFVSGKTKKKKSAFSDDDESDAGNDDDVDDDMSDSEADVPIAVRSTPKPTR